MKRERREGPPQRTSAQPTPPPRLRGIATAAVSALALASSCTGLIGEPGTRPDDPRNQPAPPDGGTPPPTCTPPTQLPVYMRRLSVVEYGNTVRDLLGGTAPAALTSGLPADTSVYGFDNNAETFSFSTTRAEAYRDAAATAAQWATDPARRAMVVGCDPAADRAGCVSQFAGRFARRAFRRPLATDEVAALANVAAVAMDDPDPYASIRLVIQAALRSSEFLFRVERGTPVTDRTPGTVKLTGYEIATRLSYLILRTTPSDALLDAARTGQLDTADGVANAARMMLADPAARDAMHGFFAGWLRLDRLTTVRRDATRFPAWNDALRDAMREETLRFVDDIAWGANGNMLDLLTARYTFVNGALATLYGLPAGGDAWRRVDFPAGSTRAGLLTQGSVLTLNADHVPLTTIRRGAWVRDVVMCDELPPPPPGVPAPPPAAPGQSERDRLALHRQSPSCSGCHEKTDPIGFGLGGFDDIGAPRTVDSQGQPIDASGQIIELAAAGNFNGPAELGARLRTMPRVAECMVRQVFRYTFARTETVNDGCVISRAADTFRTANYNFRELLVALVRTDAFRYREPPAVQSTGGGM